MSGLLLREPLGERRFAITDFPIAVGGQGSTVVMAGRPPGAEAYLGLHEDQLFVQPVDDAEVLHNGLRVQNSTGEEFGEARLYEQIKQKAPMNSQAFVNFVGSAIDQFHAETPQNDDITISTVKRLK